MQISQLTQITYDTAAIISHLIQQLSVYSLHHILNKQLIAQSTPYPEIVFRGVSVFYRPFPFPIFPPPWSGLSNQAKGFVGALLAPASGGSDKIALLVYLEPRECVWWLQMSSHFC